MFIVWGRKITRRQLGHVADFCGICRGPRAFKVQRVGSAGHVYYVSFGEGQLVGHERTCMDCGTVSAANAAAYTSISKLVIPFEQLKRQTFPNLDAAIEDRLSLEARVKEAPHTLSKEEREALIRNPFLLLSPKVEHRFSSTHIDAGVGLAILGALLLLFAAPAVVDFLKVDAVEQSFFIALAIGTTFIVWQSLASGPRYMRRNVLPILAKSLKPLDPTESEVARTLQELKQAGHKIGKKLKPADVIESTRAG